MSQTMLFTKRLTAFLNQNASPQLHTLLLLSPTGKLLSASSPASASILREQATQAVYLWTQYQNTRIPNPDMKHAQAEEVTMITVQCEYGIICIRGLSSGLLFVAIGASHAPPLNPNPQYLSPAPESLSLPGSPGLQEAHGSQVSFQGSVRSDVGSIGSERAAQASIWSVRRRAEDVGNALEKRLEGFVLSEGAAEEPARVFSGNREF